MRGPEDMVVAVCVENVKGKDEELSRQEYIVVSLIEMGSERGTKGKMSRRGEIGTAGRRKWESGNKLQK